MELPIKAYYTPEEVATHLSVTADTIRKMCSSGQIPGVRKVGKQWRIPRNWVIGEQPPEKPERTTFSS